jgi:hypothetical protein
MYEGMNVKTAFLIIIQPLLVLKHSTGLINRQKLIPALILAPFIHWRQAEQLLLPFIRLNVYTFIRGFI